MFSTIYYYLPRNALEHTEQVSIYIEQTLPVFYLEILQMLNVNRLKDIEATDLPS